jgi:hypothetical protein
MCGGCRGRVLYQRRIVVRAAVKSAKRTHMKKEKEKQGKREEEG